jgi:hypothetical protein
MARQAPVQTLRSAQAPTLDQLKEAVSSIFKSALDDLSANGAKAATNGDKPRLFFPNGINYISIDVTFEPSKLDFKVDLVVSSLPPVKPLTAEAMLADGSA